MTEMGMAVAICEAAGLDPNRVRALSLEFKLLPYGGVAALLEVEMVIPEEAAPVFKRFRLRPEEMG